VSDGHGRSPAIAPPGLSRVIDLRDGQRSSGRSGRCRPVLREALTLGIRATAPPMGPGGAPPPRVFPHRVDVTYSLSWSPRPRPPGRADRGGPRPTRPIARNHRRGPNLGPSTYQPPGLPSGLGRLDFPPPRAHWRRPAAG
jgi:hypothetical protein